MALNNLQGLIYHKTWPNTPIYVCDSIHIYLFQFFHIFLSISPSIYLSWFIHDDWKIWNVTILLWMLSNQLSGEKKNLKFFYQVYQPLIMEYFLLNIWTQIYTNRVNLQNPSTRTGCDTRSIFKRSLTCLNLEFPFS